jgi:SAM-dependent methyltransferase
MASFHGVVLDIGCGEAPYYDDLLSPPSRASKYIGIDIKNDCKGIIPDQSFIIWDGVTMPVPDASVDCALATELFEHTPDPELVMQEALRVLKPGGLLFFTVPFLWPLHIVPYDYRRFTPFGLERHLSQSGFTQIEIKATGGWHAALAQFIGLFLRRGPIARVPKFLLSTLAIPVVQHLLRLDRPQSVFKEDSMFTGLYGTAVKPLS